MGSLVGNSIKNVNIEHMDQLENFLAMHDVQIGIVCTPVQFAQEIALKLTQGGVKSIWNFAPTDIVIEGVSIENVHLGDGLYILAYRMKEDAGPVTAG